MKKADLYNFQRGLEMAKFTHPRITYAIQKNKRKVDSIIKDMEATIKATDKLNEFIHEREELAKKYAEKDENNNPITKMAPGPDGKVQRIYVIPGQNDLNGKYRKELTKLEKKYDDEIKAHAEKIRRYNEEFLIDESEFEPHMVDISLLEQYEKCPQEVMDLIFWMIKE
jgi:hypothetical protein